MRYVIFDLNAYPDWGYKSIKSVLIGLLLDVILVMSTLKILPLTLVLIKTIGKKSGAFRSLNKTRANGKILRAQNWYIKT